MANEAQTKPATESAEDLARRFAALTARWKHETLYSSKAKTIAAHPAYREVVAMGEKAVPLILADLEKEADHWFMALGEDAFNYVDRATHPHFDEETTRAIREAAYGTLQVIFDPSRLEG